jgi:hypothetical protein
MIPLVVEMAGKQVQSGSQGKVQRGRRPEELSRKRKEEEKEVEGSVRSLLWHPAADGLTTPESDSDKKADGRWQVRQTTIGLDVKNKRRKGKVQSPDLSVPPDGAVE